MRSINSYIRINELPKEVSHLVQLIICLSAVASCLLFLSLWAFFKKGHETYLKCLKTSLFLIGLIIFFALAFVILLHAIDVMLSMGCGFKSDLHNPEQYNSKLYLI